MDPAFSRVAHHTRGVPCARGVRRPRRAGTRYDFAHDVDDIARLGRVTLRRCLGSNRVHGKAAEVALGVTNVRDGELQVAGPAVIQDFAQQSPRTLPGPHHRLGEFHRDRSHRRCVGERIQGYATHVNNENQSAQKPDAGNPFWSEAQRSSKSQAPSSRKAPSSKHQNIRRSSFRCTVLVDSRLRWQSAIGNPTRAGLSWSLRFGAYRELGTWCLVLRGEGVRHDTGRCVCSPSRRTTAANTISGVSDRRHSKGWK